MLNQLFENFKKLNDICDGEIIEISVKQHQINILCKDGLFHLDTIWNIIKDLKNSKKNLGHDSFISTYNDNLHILISDLNPDMDTHNIFYSFMQLIWLFAENICSCPSLEYSISGQYLKCFLDKPGLKIDDLKKYEEILKAEGQGDLEMHPQRPYLLFINGNWEVEDVN